MDFLSQREEEAVAGILQFQKSTTTTTTSSNTSSAFLAPPALSDLQQQQQQQQQQFQQLLLLRQQQQQKAFMMLPVQCTYVATSSPPTSTSTSTSTSSSVATTLPFVAAQPWSGVVHTQPNVAAFPVFPWQLWSAYHQQQQQQHMMMQMQMQMQIQMQQQQQQQQQQQLQQQQEEEEGSVENEAEQLVEEPVPKRKSCRADRDSSKRKRNSLIQRRRRQQQQQQQEQDMIVDSQSLVADQSSKLQLQFHDEHPLLKQQLQRQRLQHRRKQQQQQQQQQVQQEQEQLSQEQEIKQEQAQQETALVVPTVNVTEDPSSCSSAVSPRHSPCVTGSGSSDSDDDGKNRFSSIFRLNVSGQLHGFTIDDLRPESKFPDQVRRRLFEIVAMGLAGYGDDDVQSFMGIYQVSSPMKETLMNYRERALQKRQARS